MVAITKTGGSGELLPGRVRELGDLFSDASDRIFTTALAIRHGAFGSYPLEMLETMRDGIEGGLDTYQSLDGQHESILGESHPNYEKYVQIANHVLEKINEEMGRR